MTASDCFACFEEISEIVAETKGLFRAQTKGLGDARLVSSIWRSVGGVLEEELLMKRSCVVPDFFHISVKKHSSEFWDGPHHFYKLQIILLPDFISKFHFKNILTTPDAHYHATVPCNVSTIRVASLSGTSRFVVEAALRDIPREVGKYLRNNRHTTLVIDIHVAKLEFRDREMRIKWSPAFLDAFSKVVGPNALIAPYDPPGLTRGAEKCRFQTGCLDAEKLHASVSAAHRASNETYSFMKQTLNGMHSSVVAAPASHAASSSRMPMHGSGGAV